MQVGSEFQFKILPSYQIYLPGAAGPFLKCEWVVFAVNTGEPETSFVFLIKQSLL